MKAFCAASLLLATMAAASGPAVQLRVQPVAEYPNDAALRLMLRKLQTVGTFMQTTAHPDDEDNTLLAMVGHGQGMRTVLVSASRGEGGQNEIGPELGDALSVLRTEELLAAHRFDGAEQLFTRAIDFGYSFSVEETLQKWGREAIVGDYVRHIRATRPHVIAAFVCGGEGGGQHHQASTALTVEAVRDAADPSKYPEQIRDGLKPWRVTRLFCTEGFGARDRNANLLRVAGNEFDPLLGRTYAELGTEARSMHKCQGTTQLLPLPGASQGRAYRLLEARNTPGRPPLETMFDGIDTSIVGLSASAGGDASIVTALRHISDAATAGDLTNGLRLVSELRRSLERTRTSNAGHEEIDFRMAQKQRQFERALLISRGVRLEALADDGVVIAGQPAKIEAVVSDNGRGDVEVRGVTVGGVVDGTMPCWGADGRVRACALQTRIASVAPTTIYWKARDDVARYDFEPLGPSVPPGVSFAPSPFMATFDLTVAGLPVTVVRPVEHRYSDIVAGEKRMELHAVPSFGVQVTPSIVVVPQQPAAGARHEREIRVAVTNHTKGAASGAVRLRVPAGWTVSPQQAPVKFAREDEVVTATFALQPPAKASSGEFSVDATFSAADGGESRAGYQVIEYPHIRRRHIVRPASARVKVIDARIMSGRRVGYIMGVGDQVPDAIRQLGADVRMIGADELASGDLGRYDVIVTGVRAYERRADLRASNHRLLAYAENGGTVLVQYNKFEFNEAQYGPFPAKVSANRIADESAPVEVLVPSHPLFNRPNRIGPEAWAGWVQERGLYFLGDRDPRYVDLVAMTDPFPFNPGRLTGALVEAKVGRGRWIYIGLGLWRQLPAGTEGAYRLLANLLSLTSGQP